MENALDLAIARLANNQHKWEEEDERERLRKQYDPKERITYTLEELIEGIKQGRQYLYTLLLEFEQRQVIKESLTIPFVKNFYDVVDDEDQVCLLASNKYKVVLNISKVPCGSCKKEESLDKWVARTKEEMKKVHLHIKPEKKASMENVEYFCYALPTSEGKLYNVVFRLRKGNMAYAGNYSCPEEERKGMGLLLEAMVCVIGEMNR